MTFYDTFRRLIDEQIPFAVATVIAGPEEIGAKAFVYADSRTEDTQLSPELAEPVTADAVRLLTEERSETIRYLVPSGEYDVFIDVYPVAPQLVIVGATHAAIPLSHLGRMLGYRVIVTDARGAFARPERFPDADEVLKGWPQDVLPDLRIGESTYIVLLSHDPKFDQPTLDLVLPSRAPYIGAIGSRKTQRERSQRLRDAGFSLEQLSRIYGPVGLDIGGRSVEEMALAIMAEITAVRYGKQAGFKRSQA